MSWSPPWYNTGTISVHVEGTNRPASYLLSYNPSLMYYLKHLHKSILAPSEGNTAPRTSTLFKGFYTPN
uniref:X-LRR protein n=1 Tax=Manihot esculenta TaxID=3983 RepID=Q5XNQ4_MANES|nr:X-LRR protein [Manihot esculenta]